MSPFPLVRIAAAAILGGIFLAVAAFAGGPLGMAAAVIGGSLVGNAVWTASGGHDDGFTLETSLPPPNGADTSAEPPPQAVTPAPAASRTWLNRVECSAQAEATHRRR